MAAWTETEKQLNMMLIGMTGEGKSATGNTILGQRLFTAATRTTSVTQDVSDKFTRFDDFILKVVDCPGLMDTNRDIDKDMETAATNMGVALGKCCNGVDAFLLVITRQRFKGEQRKTLEALKQIFGDKYLQNLIVVVTGADRFQDDMENDDLGDITFHEWCMKEEGDFGKLYQEFKDKFLHVNNREKCPKTMYAQRREIVQMVETLRKVNGRYTSKYFEDAEALRNKLIVEAKKPMLNETIQKRVGLLVTDLLELRRTPSDSQRESIQQSVSNLMDEITKIDRGTGLLKHLLAEVENVQTALHSLDELHRLAKKLEEIRVEKNGWTLHGLLSAGLTVASTVGLGGLAVVSGPVVAPVAVGAVAFGGLTCGAGYLVGLTQAIKSYVQRQHLSESEKCKTAEKDDLESKFAKVTMGGQ